MNGSLSGRYQYYHLLLSLLLQLVYLTTFSTAHIQVLLCLLPRDDPHKKTPEFILTILQVLIKSGIK
jgi:hypothetical protein